MKQTNKRIKSEIFGRAVAVAVVTITILSVPAYNGPIFNKHLDNVTHTNQKWEEESST